MLKAARRLHGSSTEPAVCIVTGREAGQGASQTWLEAARHQIAALFCPAGVVFLRPSKPSPRAQVMRGVCAVPCSCRAWCRRAWRPLKESIEHGIRKACHDAVWLQMASGYMGRERWEVWPGTLFWSYVKDPLARQRTGWPPGGENISHLLSSRYQYIVVGWEQREQKYEVR